jgi:hypothetical protein
MSQYIIIGDGYSSSSANYIEITDGYNSSASNYLIFGQGGNYIPPTPPSTFNPTDLSNLALWLRSDLGITLNGSNVSAWADQSGNGNNFSANSAGPLYTGSDSSFGGQPSLGGASNADWLIGPTTENIIGASSTAAEYFMAILPDNTSDHPISQGFSDLTYFYFSGQIYDSFYTTPRVNGLSSGVSSGSFVYNANSSGSNWNAFVNGSSIFSSTSQTFNFINDINFTLFGALSAIWQGKMAEIIVYSRVLTSIERGQVNTYLSSRYGITI